MLNIGDLNPWSGLVFASAGRGLDLLSTWWLTPRLTLEGNPLVRRFGWRYAIVSSIIFPVLGYFIPAIGVMLGTMSCIIAFSNMHNAMIIRYAPDGQQRLRRLMQDALGNCNAPQRFMASFLFVVPMLSMGLILLVLGIPRGMGYTTCVGVGAMAYCLLFGYLRVCTFIRLRHASNAAAS